MMGILKSTRWIIMTSKMNAFIRLTFLHARRQVVEEPLQMLERVEVVRQAAEQPSNILIAIMMTIHKRVCCKAEVIVAIAIVIGLAMIFALETLIAFSVAVEVAIALLRLVAQTTIIASATAPSLVFMMISWISFNTLANATCTTSMTGARGCRRHIPLLAAQPESASSRIPTKCNCNSCIPHCTRKNNER